MLLCYQYAYSKSLESTKESKILYCLTKFSKFFQSLKFSNGAYEVTKGITW